RPVPPATTEAAARRMRSGGPPPRLRPSDGSARVPPRSPATGTPGDANRLSRAGRPGSAEPAEKAAVLLLGLFGGGGDFGDPLVRVGPPGVDRLIREGGVVLGRLDVVVVLRLGRGGPILLRPLLWLLGRPRGAGPRLAGRRGPRGPRNRLGPALLDRGDGPRVEGGGRGGLRFGIVDLLGLLGLLGLVERLLGGGVHSGGQRIAPP